MMRRLSASSPATAALALCLLTLGLYWPGFATFDSVVQYRQILAGSYDDWHPPIMARLWALLGGASLGTAPMFLLQTGLYWLGLGLLGERLRRTGRVRAGWTVLALGLLPPVVGWQVVVLKDAQMLGALVAATGLAGWWRLDGRPVPMGGWAVIVLLLGYAALIRTNAAFAVVPLAVLLAPPPLRWPTRGLLMLGGIMALLAAAPLINRHLLRASDSGVTRSQAIYDLAGIAARSGRSMPEGPALLAGHCVTPFYWDQLGEGACGVATAHWQSMTPASLYRQLALAILRHPLAYTRQRLSHLNSTERWLVTANWRNAAPPRASEPERAGLSAPSRTAATAQFLLGLLTATPLGWPVCWLVVASLALTGASRSPDTATATLARALAVSAFALEASFLVISIASDLRYHLWPMLAAGLALALVADRVDRRHWLIGLSALALLIVTGTAARLLLTQDALLPTGAGQLIR